LCRSGFSGRDWLANAARIAAGFAPKDAIVAAAEKHGQEEPGQNVNEKSRRFFRPLPWIMVFVSATT
jgi:hypothetical protein